MINPTSNTSDILLQAIRRHLAAEEHLSTAENLSSAEWREAVEALGDTFAELHNLVEVLS